MELDEVGALPQAIHALEEAEKVAAKSKEPATLINVRAFQSECTRMLKILRYRSREYSRKGETPLSDHSKLIQLMH